MEETMKSKGVESTDIESTMEDNDTKSKTEDNDVESKMEENDIDSKDAESKTLDKKKVFALIIVSIVLLGSVYYYINYYPHSMYVGGVRIHSQTPISEEDLQKWKKIALFNTSDAGAITCNLELSAVSDLSNRGYKIYVEKDADKGIYISKTEAHIKGSTESDILDACHAFICLREGIKCPDNLRDIENIMLGGDNMSIIVDNDVVGSGVRAYVEIVGAFGYLQSSLFGTEGKRVLIYLYLQEDDRCTLQDLQTMLQDVDGTNESIDCNIPGGIYLLKSDKNEIQIKGDKIILLGDDEHLYTEAIIIRSILSPEYVRAQSGW